MEVGSGFEFSADGGSYKLQGLPEYPQQLSAMSQHRMPNVYEPIDNSVMSAASSSYNGSNNYTAM